MTVRVRFPITLNVGADALVGSGLDHTLALFALRFLEIWRQAQADLDADGVAGEPEVTIGFDWQGPARRRFSQDERHEIQRRFHAILAQAVARTGPPPETTTDWAIDRLEFRAVLYDLLEVIKDLPGGVDYFWMLYRDYLDREVVGVAWVVTVQQPVRWQRIREEIGARRDRELGHDALFAFFWTHRHTEALRALDRVHLADLPILSEQEMAPRQVTDAMLVGAGVRVLFLAVKLPEIVVGDYIVFGVPFTVRLTLDRVFDPMDPILSWDTVEATLGLTAGGMEWFQLLQAYGVTELSVWVLPFAVRQPIGDTALHTHVGARATATWPTAGEVGRLWLLGPHALAVLPDDVTGSTLHLADADADADADAVADAPDQLGPYDDWQPGWRGVFTVPLVDWKVLARQIDFAGKMQLGAFERMALRLIDILDLDDPERYYALGEWSNDWALLAPEAADLVLVEVDKLHALDRFFDAWIASNLYPVVLRRLIAPCVKTRYARHPKLLAIIAKLERWQGGLLLHGYDVDQQRVLLFGDDDEVIRAAGDSADPAAGVVAETSSYYSEPGKAKRPTKATLERMTEPVQRHAGEIMAGLICRGDESMDERAILAEAFQRAGKELGLDPDRDFESVSVTMSLRVVKLERRPSGGVEDLVVHYQPVYRIAGDVWTNAGPVEVVDAVVFEAKLKHYHLQHLSQALTIFMLAEMIVFGGAALVGMGIAGVGELLLFVFVSDAIYIWTHRHGGFTVTGFLMATLVAELELLGFKGVGKLLGFGGKLAGDLAVKALTRVLGVTAVERLGTWTLTRVATKWIAFALRAGATGVGFGAVATIELLAHDLFVLNCCEKGSSSADYWNRFKWGAIIGTGMELIAIPVLAPLVRPMVEKVGTKLEAIALLHDSGKTFGEITKLVLEGSEAMDKALGRAVENPAVTEPLARGFRQRMLDLLRTYGREYEARAYRALIEMLDKDLSARAAKTLARLVAATTERELDELLAALARSKTPPAELLDLMAALDDATLARLVQSGNLAALGDAPALLALLRRNATLGWITLDRVFASAVADCEGFLARFTGRPTVELDNALAVLLRPGNTLAPGLVADLIVKQGAITVSQAPLLDRLAAANVRLSAFVDGKGPTLAEFEQAWADLTAAEQTNALASASGRPPATILEQAQQTRETLARGARLMDPTRSQLADDLASGARSQARDEVKASFRERKRAPGPHEDKILVSVLRKNRAEYLRMRAELERFNPDAIIGVERSGPLVADAATYGNPSLRGRIVRIGKLRKAELEMAEARAQVEAMIADGKRRFAFTDVFMSGSARSKFLNDVVEPLAQAHPECQFRGLWMREQLGFEQAVSPAGPPVMRAPRALSLANVENLEYEVPFILGDDTAKLVGTAAGDAKAIYLFDELGRIVETFTPKPGESARDLFLRVLWDGKI